MKKRIVDGLKAWLKKRDQLSLIKFIFLGLFAWALFTEGQADDAVYGLAVGLVATIAAAIDRMTRNIRLRVVHELKEAAHQKPVGSDDA